MSIPFGCPFSDPLHSKWNACLLRREPGLPREPSNSSCPACVAMFCAHPCTARRTLRIRLRVFNLCVSKLSAPWLLLLATQSACQYSLHLTLPWASHCDISPLVATLAPRSETGLLGLSMSRLPLKSKRTSLIRSCSLQRFCGGVASRDTFTAAMPSAVLHVLWKTFVLSCLSRRDERTPELLSLACIMAATQCLFQPLPSTLPHSFP